MQLILRKNDSATSVLLFIYNNYHEKTSRDCLKLSSLLEIMSAFGKTETAVRMSLSRAVKAGILENQRQEGEVVYKLTQAGMGAVKLWNTGAQNFWKRYKRRFENWDGHWCILNLSFDESGKAVKESVTEELELLGFAAMSQNTWLSAFHLKTEVTQILTKNNLLENAAVFRGEMEPLMDMKQFLDKQFDIRQLNEAYRLFNEAFAPRLEEMKEKAAQSGTLEPENMLPILHELGWSFFKIASHDKVLPQNLLPHWEGDKAAQVMGDFRHLLLEHIDKYLDKFD